MFQLAAVAAFIAANVKYVSVAIAAGQDISEAWPRIQDNLEKAYNYMLRGTPLSEDEKADMDARHDAISKKLDDDFAAREQEAADMDSKK